MVVFYSFGGLTKKYAEQLSFLLKDSVFELKEKEQRSVPTSFVTRAGKSILKMKTEAHDLPDVSGDRIIYLCTPIYASNVPPVVRYFIENSNLEGKKINLILVCSMITNAERYKKNVISNFVDSKCKIGFAHVFAGGKRGQTDDETITEHLKEIVLNIDKSY